MKKILTSLALFALFPALAQADTTSSRLERVIQKVLECLPPR